MAPRVTFYDMPFADRLALIAKFADNAWKRRMTMLIVAADQAMAEEVDTYLWGFEPDAFLPHEILRADGELKDRDARIVIARPEDALERVPGRDVVVLLAPVDIDFAAGFTAVVEVVAREDLAATELSRERYRGWLKRGIKPAHRTVEG